MQFRGGHERQANTDRHARSTANSHGKREFWPSLLGALGSIVVVGSVPCRVVSEVHVNGNLVAQGMGSRQNRAHDQ
jgi:hypothetical protein